MTKSKAEIGVAFLGVGRMGETHLRNLAGVNGVRVRVVADPVLEAVQGFVGEETGLRGSGRNEGKRNERARRQTQVRENVPLHRQPPPRISRRQR